MIDALPAAPDPATDSPAEFSAKAAASVLAQKNMVDQFNSEVASLNALFAGGAYAFMFAFDSSTANADPGPGKLRLSASTQSSATAMYIDPVTSSGANIDSLFASIGASTSFTKGAIRLVKAMDPSTWALFDVMSVAAASGYRSLAVTFRASSAASPFANGDALMLYIDRVGDRAVDQSAMVRLDGVTIASPVAAVSYPNIFSDEFASYQIEIPRIKVSATDTLCVRFAVAGSLVTSLNYAPLSPNNSGTIGSGSLSQFEIAPILGSGNGMASYTLDVRGARSGANYTGLGVRGFQVSGAAYSTILEGVFTQNASITGFSLFLKNGNNLSSGEVNIYGLRRAI